MERTFPKSVASLDRIFDFLREFAGGAPLDAGSSFAIQVAVEEIFVNMVKHNPRATTDVLIRLERDGPAVRIQLTDYDVDPFDVANAPLADTGQPIHERNPGGLGIHLVRNLMDDVRYEYINRTSTVTLTKYLER